MIAISSDDVARALELLDAMEPDVVAGLRASIARTAASLRTPGGGQPAPTATVQPPPEHDPVFAAFIFFLWTTSDESFERSL